MFKSERPYTLSAPNSRIALAEIGNRLSLITEVDELSVLMSCLARCEVVDESEGVFVPNENVSIKLTFIARERCRPLTKEEEENKELKDAKMMKEYYRNQSNNQATEIESLRRQLKAKELNDA